MKEILFTGFLLFLTACSSTQKRVTGNLTLDTVMKLSCDRDTESSVISALGMPDKKIIILIPLKCFGFTSIKMTDTNAFL